MDAIKVKTDKQAIREQCVSLKIEKDIYIIQKLLRLLKKRYVMSYVELNGIKRKTWDDIRKEMFAFKEIAGRDLRVALIDELTKARKEKGNTQKELEHLSVVKQSVIARLENGCISPKQE